MRVRFAQARSSAKAIDEPVFCGDVAELVDAADLKSVDFGRPGSIPGVPTIGLGSISIGGLDIGHAVEFIEHSFQHLERDRDAMALFRPESPVVHDMADVVVSFSELCEYLR